MEELTRLSIIAVRQTTTTDKTSRDGSGRQQLYKSPEVSIDIPSREFGLSLLNGIGTVTSDTSHMTKVMLTGAEVRAMLPAFPLLVKKCADGATFRAFMLKHEYRYAFVDTVVDEAEVKIKKSTFTIQFKARQADERDADEDASLDELSFEEWLRCFELKPNLIQSYRFERSSDIPGHTPHYI